MQLFQEQFFPHAFLELLDHKLTHTNTHAVAHTHIYTHTHRSNVVSRTTEPGVDYRPRVQPFTEGRSDVHEEADATGGPFIPRCDRNMQLS